MENDSIWQFKCKTVKLTIQWIKKRKKKGPEVTLNLPSNVIGDSNDETSCS